LLIYSIFTNDLLMDVTQVLAVTLLTGY